MKENLIAILKDGVVENIVVGSDEWASSLADETVNVTDVQVGIGWQYVNGEFITPEGKTKDEFLHNVQLELERSWRDVELSYTDKMIVLTDHPKHAEYLTYRQELRDYPSQPNFPYGERPVRP